MFQQQFHSLSGSAKPFPLCGWVINKNNLDSSVSLCLFCKTYCEERRNRHFLGGALSGRIAGRNISGGTDYSSSPGAAPLEKVKVLEHRVEFLLNGRLNHLSEDHGS